MSKKNDNIKKTSIGGQALIEGVMMRGPKKTAIAVRNKSGRICLEEWENVVRKSAWFKIPFVRGIFNFVDSMKIGYKALMRSADISEQEDEVSSEDNSKNNDTKNLENQSVLDANKEVTKELDSEKEKDLDKNTSNPYSKKADGEENTLDKQKKENEDSQKSGDSLLIAIAMTIGSCLGTVIAVILFVALPTAVCNLLKRYVSVLDNNLAQSAFEGILKIIIFLAYISVISLWEDMRRVFMYHGAEHKTIFCYEHGLELTVENVRKQSRFHPRCGTSFIIFMLIIGIFVSMFIPNSIPTVYRTCIKLLCLPVIMGIGYEAIKLAGRKDNLFVRIMSAPGLWVQKLSTKEPDDDMIECAIASFLAVVPNEEENDTTDNGKKAN